MRWLDKRIDAFIRRVRDDPHTKKLPIGPEGDPHYWRYYVIRRNRFLNIYLHCFLHSDYEYLHDHRMMNISVILQGSYAEERFVKTPVGGKELPAAYVYHVDRLHPLMRLPSTPHRVVLYQDVEQEGKAKQVWSLFVGFPHVRNWGMWTRCQGFALWVPHECVVKKLDPETAGYGQQQELAL